jgi:hypothetical protein
MKYPHKEDLFKVLNDEVEFDKFLKNFTKISEFESSHPVHSFIFIIKDIIFKNSEDILENKIESGILCSALNVKLEETFNSMKSSSENSAKMGEKDRYEVSDLEKGFEFSKKLVDEICYAYSED